MAIKCMITAIVTNNIDNVIFMGDYFHSRSLISSDTINIAYKCMQALAKKCRVVLILGNHDLFMKNSVDIHSLNMFQDIPNVEIVSKPIEVKLNNSLCLLVPWLSDLSEFKQSSYDMMFGHFDVSSKYLIQSYVEEHTQKVRADESIKMKTTSDFGNQSADSVGSFVELAKNDGVVFAGHIHQHKEFIAKHRHFVFVGSPYQQTLGDIDNDTGFYIIDENGKYEFNPITNIPIHIQLPISEIMSKGIEEFDYSIVSNNIVQRIYDIDINTVDDQQISQHIFNAKPYEELLPEYQVDINTTLTKNNEQNAIEIIRKSKLEYIRNYIDTLNNDELIEKNINKDKLFDVLEKYYKKVSE